MGEAHWRGGTERAPERDSLRPDADRLLHTANGSRAAHSSPVAARRPGFRRGRNVPSPFMVAAHPLGGDARPPGLGRLPSIPPPSIAQLSATARSWSPSSTSASFRGGCPTDQGGSSGHGRGHLRQGLDSAGWSPLAGGYFRLGRRRCHIRERARASSYIPFRKHERIRERQSLQIRQI